MTDFLSQLRQLKKMGGMGGLLGMLPGIGKMQKAIKAAGIDDDYFNKQEAIILSMNKKERRQGGFAECVTAAADCRRIRNVCTRS